MVTYKEKLRALSKPSRGPGCIWFCGGFRAGLENCDLLAVEQDIAVPPKKIQLLTEGSIGEKKVDYEDANKIISKTED